MWLLSASDIGDLARGAALLGAGGGGPTYAASLMASHVLADRGPLEVVDAAELESRSLVVPLGLMGSVTVFEEKPMAGDELARAVRVLERYNGSPVEGVCAFEAAGVNGVLPVLAAADLRLPLVDADGMGRAFPEISQTVFTLNHLSIAPLVLADDKGSVNILDGVDAYMSEQLARSAVVAMGGWAMVALAPQRAGDLVKYAIPGNVRKAVELGRILRTGDVSSLMSRHGGRYLFQGRVVDLERRSSGRFRGGSAVLRHLRDSSRHLRLEFQNENLLAIEDGEVRACVPDLICLLSKDQLVPVTAEQIRFGLEIEVVTLPSPPAWRTPAGLGIAGPRAFGYDVPYALPRGER
jgi:DUF917 family protein